MRHLYVISDLHLGGAPDARDDDGNVTAVGSQFCNAYDHLAAFIDWIASPGSHPRGEVELVINGDIVDFFASDEGSGGPRGARAWTADPEEAIARLRRIMARASAVFDALTRFTVGGHRLTLLLGNHDLELSHPAVRALLERSLGPDARMRFIYDGEAYAVGRVLVEHGNRYDRWNVIDHSRLRQERSMRSRGLVPNEDCREERYFLPPAGSHLVVRFMNRVKARYRFVDMLKPETGAVLPLLVALEPDHRVELEEALAAGATAFKLWGHGRAEAAKPEHPGDLSAADAGPTLAAELQRELRGDAGVFGDEVRETVWGGDMMAGATRRRVKDWLDARAGPLGDGLRSLWKVADLAAERDSERRRSKLLVALRHLNCNDRSFDPSLESAGYLDAATDIAVRGDFDLVVFGHTHLPKRVPIDASGRPALYLNTGTWTDVMRLPPELAASPLPAEAVERAAVERRASCALDEFVAALRDNRFDQYVRRYLSYVEATVDDAGRVLEAEVRSYGGPSNPRAPVLTDVREKGVRPFRG